VIQFADLLIGATALSLGYSVLTVNPRNFERVPGLSPEFEPSRVCSTSTISMCGWSGLELWRAAATC
jgi:hypothetical protein